MRRALQEIRTFFTNSVTANRRRIFQTERNAELLLSILQDNRQKGHFQLHAFAIMPDHIHLLLTPAENVSIEKAMQYIKGRFSFQLKSSFDVWERSFKEHRIKDEQDYINHLQYIEQNPVRANLAQPQNNSHTPPLHHVKSTRCRLISPSHSFRVESNDI